MRKLMMAIAATATLGAFGLAAPASAAETRTAPVSELTEALRNGDLNTSWSQYRYYDGGRRHYDGPRRYYGSRYGYSRPSYYQRRYGYAPRYYRRDRGDAVAAGALGLAAGAILGGALAQQQAQPTYVVPNQTGSVSYCAQRYRSYDPRSGTYLGYDGRRHPCP